MFLWKLSEGLLYQMDGAFALTKLGQGYSGDAEHQNQPASTHLINEGPLPVGLYLIGPVRDVNGGPHGPFVLPLRPASVNLMYDRKDFLIHGGKSSDIPGQPGTASEGCIVLPLPIRQKINAGTDKVLVVID